MTADERREIEEWIDLIGKALQRLNRDFDNFKEAVDGMKTTFDRFNELTKKDERRNADDQE